MRTDQFRVLVRHFFRALFDFGILSDVGSESFKRKLLGSAAVAIGLGLLLVRVFLGKYANLAGASALEYQSALAADHAFLMAWPMWIVAVAVVLVGHSLFPDETDFRVLMAQPISQGTVFAAKLSALFLFVGLIVAGVHVALFPLLAVTLINPHALAAFIVALPVYWLAGLAASAFAVLAVVAIHGGIVLLVPRAGLVTFAASLRSALLCALVLVVPLIARLPGIAGAVAADVSWLRWIPPMWFVGAERWLLGGEKQSVFVALAAVALLASAMISAVAYVILYRRFDRLTVRTRSGRRSRPRRWMTAAFTPERAVHVAVARFSSMTLGRSVLHQGIVVAFLAAGLGLVLSTMLTAEIWAAVWALCSWIFIAVPSVRLALSVPVEPRANWIFRMTEVPGLRASAIGAAVMTAWRLGVAIPVIVMLPILWLLSGAQALMIAVLASAAGWLLVEIQMQDWPRIPFTCSYIPGKGFVPQMFVKGVAAFLVVPTGVTLLIRAGVLVPAAAVLIFALAAGPATLLLLRRRRRAVHAPLEFEDQLPTEINVLGLTD